MFTPGPSSSEIEVIIYICGKPGKQPGISDVSCVRGGIFVSRLVAECQFDLLN
jgi:hypothetical protein